jgi:hypothetical protein
MVLFGDVDSSIRFAHVDDPSAYGREQGRLEGQGWGRTGAWAAAGEEELPLAGSAGAPPPPRAGWEGRPRAPPPLRLDVDGWRRERLGGEGQRSPLDWEGDGRERWRDAGGRRLRMRMDGDRRVVDS